MTREPRIDRRRFLQITGGAAAATALSASVARAAQIAPAVRTGTVDDVEHIVVLMQENRSFDHYFGSLRGVRGFGDPHPVIQPAGQTYPERLEAAGCRCRRRRASCRNRSQACARPGRCRMTSVPTA